MVNLSLTHTPPAIALSENDLIFKVETDNYLASAGAYAGVYLKFTNLPAAGDTFQLLSKYFDLTFEFVDGNPDNSGQQIKRDYPDPDAMLSFRTFMAGALEDNYHINKYFNVTHGFDTYDYVHLEAKEPGFMWLEQPESGTSCPNMVAPYDVSNGANRTYKHPYFIESRLSISDYEESICPNSTDLTATFNFKKMIELEGGFMWPESLGSVAREDMLKTYKLYYWENFNNVYSKIFSSTMLKVLQGGISKADSKSLSDDDSTWYDKWLENKWFLTWQPSGHLIDLNSTLKLYALITATNTYRLKWKINDDDQNQNSISLGELTANKVYEVISSPGLAFAYLGDYVTDVEYFDIWIERTSDSVKVSEVRRYFMDWKYREFRREFLFSNSYIGAYDTLRFVGKGSESYELESYTYESKVYDAELKKIKQSRAKLSNPQKANTGWISREALEYMQEFLLSEDRYEIRNGKLYPVYVTSSKVSKREDGDCLYNLEIEFIYSYQEEFFSSVNGIHQQANPVSGGSNFIPQIGGAGGGHTIVSADGTELPQRSKLKFTGDAVTVTDDEGNDQTIVQIDEPYDAADQLYMFNNLNQ